MQHFEPHPFGTRFSELGADGAPCRLGIMGGTFDPIHTGHLWCAEAARAACELDGVLFLPANDPSLKQERNIAAAIDRLEMCALATFSNPHFDVGTLELERDGITYTIDTAEALRDAYTESVELFFIIGSDSLTTLCGWKDAHRLAEMIKFICVSRPSSEDTEELLTSARDFGFDIELVNTTLLDISSSDVRDRASKGEPFRYLAPYSVCEYIMSRGMYGSGSLDGKQQ